jgi:hypothetical protein
MSVEGDLPLPVEGASPGKKQFDSKTPILNPIDTTVEGSAEPQNNPVTIEQDNMGSNEKSVL